ncbi:MAG: hypothetical protein GXY95_07545 [Clostridiales bacterium]|jgi:cell division protein FtsL|nr:hypothetical protein [Clostridiales bacterium]HOA33548.1 hypothetical protein [Clostridiales bacterium]HOJ35171.1 hypothetical protein [Clostridiales bacterium]HOL79129.1 hypothetical protein [Clostridiales bacterium]HPP67713.1 hypothetical protein [Clostridiales bacterium]
MPSYYGTEAYDFSLFEPYEKKVTSSAAPKRAPQKKTKEHPHLKVYPKVQKKTDTKKAIKLQMRANMQKSVKVFAVMALLFSMLSVKIYCNVVLDETTKEITKLEQKLAVEKSEAVRLQMAIDSIVSVKNVDEYAENVLGMMKMEPGRESYINLSKGDEVVVSGGKEVNEEPSIFRQLLAYIF